MNSLLKFVIGMTVLATIAAVNEGDRELVKMLEKEREEMKEERKEMREEQKEMRADFRREINEQNQIVAELHKENAAQKEEIQKLHAKIQKTNRQSKEIRKLHKKLHQADVQNKEAHRQRDAKQSHELEAKISTAIREERQSPDMEHVVESVVERSIRRSGKNNTDGSLEIELRKLIDARITNYLIHQRICVGGRYHVSYSYESRWFTKNISFGYEFPRKPTVSASLTDVYSNEVNAKGSFHMIVQINSITKTSASLNSLAGYGSAANLSVSWLACL